MVCFLNHLAANANHLSIGVFFLASMDSGRMKDFSVVLLDMDKRQSMFSARLEFAENRIKVLEKVNAELTTDVRRYQSIVALNNVIIGLKRDKDGNFEPMDVTNIVQELLGHAKRLTDLEDK